LAGTKCPKLSRKITSSRGVKDGLLWQRRFQGKGRLRETIKVFIVQFIFAEYALIVILAILRRK
jgi:hypothetical protein